MYGAKTCEWSVEVLCGCPTHDQNQSNEQEERVREKTGPTVENKSFLLLLQALICWGWAGRIWFRSVVQQMAFASSTPSREGEKNALEYTLNIRKGVFHFQGQSWCNVIRSVEMNKDKSWYSVPAFLDFLRIQCSNRQEGKQRALRIQPTTAYCMFKCSWSLVFQVHTTTSHHLCVSAADQKSSSHQVRR